MNIQKTLGSLTDSQFGANTSTKPTGEIPCVQGRDFDSDGIYTAKEPQFVGVEALKYTRPLENGDVLFSAKGKLFATVWLNQLPKAVATGTFLILKVIDPVILPEYLALYLNSSKAKKYFDQNIKTATVLHIGKKQLDQLMIDIPPLEKQRVIIKMHDLLLEEKKITHELFIRKENILNTLLNF